MFGSTVLIVLIIAYIVCKYYSNIRIFIIDIFHFLVHIFKCGKRTSVRLDLQTIANDSIKELNKTVPELQMPDFKIEWVKEDESGQVRFDKGKAIVMLKFSKDRTQNVINSTSAYIQSNLLTTSRPFIDEPIVKAIDYTIIQKFLKRTPQNRFAIRHFVESNRHDITLYQDSFEKVNKTDQKGLLTNILLREYTLWGDNIVTEIPTINHKIESRNILDFVYDIASRGYDEFTPLQFISNNVKIAVLLVAKIETYSDNGSRPYIRRIREGFARGINTFYLLARGDKISILKKVYGELIQTGNFICLNNPEIFYDKDGRENICYCLQVDKSGNMASDFLEINEAIGNSNEIELLIEHVYKNELKCIYNERLHVSIPVEEICDHEIRLKNYYASGMTITAVPLSIEEGGIIKASLKGTNCDPKNLIDNEYSVGKYIKAIVQKVEDEVAFLLISGSDKQAYAFRKDLTFSSYLFLHNLYPIGCEFEYEIIDIDYVSNQLKLKRKDLIDPWNEFNIQNGQIIDVTIYEVEDTYFASEIMEGIKIILPYSELSWIESDIEKEKKRIKRNSSLQLKVKFIDYERRIVIATNKLTASPYQQFFDSLENSKPIKVKLLESNSYGIIGKTLEFRVFIPTSETHIANNYFNYSIGKEYDVYIKSVSDDGLSLIGTFKPSIKHPLQVFKEDFNIGDIIKGLSIFRKYKYLYQFKLRHKKYDKCRIYLPIQEISNIAYIREFEKLESLIMRIPIIIKEIDFDNNRVELSIKDVLISNNGVKDEMEYGTTYQGTVIGRNNNKYVIVIHDYWIEGYLLTSKTLCTGDILSVRLAAHGSQYAEFCED